MRFAFGSALRALLLQEGVRTFQAASTTTNSVAPHAAASERRLHTRSFGSAIGTRPPLLVGPGVPGRSPRSGGPVSAPANCCFQ